MAQTDKWGRLIQQASPDLGAIAVRGRLAYRLPVEAVLAGIYANPSGFKKGASYLEVFAQPLYVPADHLDLTIGQRIGGGAQTYTLDELEAGQADLAEAVSFMDQRGDPAALLTAHSWGHSNIRMIEAEAYSLIWCDQPDDARSVLGLVDDMPLSYDWEREVADRIRHVQDLVTLSVAEARDQLHEWRDESIANLKLSTTSMPATD